MPDHPAPPGGGVPPPPLGLPPRSEAQQSPLTNRGELKLCDFGLARHHQPGDDGAYTPKVVTLWYRAPELLLGSPKYTAAVDMWAVGCILAELLRHEPLFPGKTEAHVLDLIFNLLGSPNDDIWPGMHTLPRASGLRLPQQPYNYLSEDFGFVGRGGVELINHLLIYDPSARCRAEEALKHPYLTQNAPEPTRKERMPTFASLHDSLNGVAREDAGDAARGRRASNPRAREKNGEGGRRRGRGGRIGSRATRRSVRRGVRVDDGTVGAWWFSRALTGSSRARRDAGAILYSSRVSFNNISNQIGYPSSTLHRDSSIGGAL